MSRGVEYNLYRGPAWPNDILYAPLVVMLGPFTTTSGTIPSAPMNLGEHTDPLTTPLEVLGTGPSHLSTIYLRGSRT